ncbi:MAG: hypothetical protein PVJ32_06965, partial [Anaerolineales bacterium]
MRADTVDHPREAGMEPKRVYGPEMGKESPGLQAEQALRIGGKVMRLAYMLLAVAAIFFFCYLFGHTQLEGALSGNDIPWALSQAQWYARWFPDLPTWFPLQGGGTPLLFLYPPGTSLIV